MYGANQAEHKEGLEAVLVRLQEATVTLNPEKCELSKETVRFLGQLVGKNGIRADPSKIAAVKYLAERTDVHELRRFLGMVNQSGKYIPNLAELSHPLCELLSKKNAWSTVAKDGQNDLEFQTHFSRTGKSRMNFQSSTPWQTQSLFRHP